MKHAQFFVGKTVHVLKENLKTWLVQVAYIDQDGETRSVQVLVNKMWARNNGLTCTIAAMNHVEAKIVGFKSFTAF